MTNHGGQRHQRDGGDALRPPVADALAGRAAAEHLAERRAQAHGATARQRRQPSHTTSAVSSNAATITTRAAAARLRALEAAARIPDQVTDAVAEVIDEGKREARPAVVWRAASAAASSPPRRRRAPTPAPSATTRTAGSRPTAATPVMRCRIDSDIVYMNLYTPRCGDSGRWFIVPPQKSMQRPLRFPVAEARGFGTLRAADFGATLRTAGRRSAGAVGRQLALRERRKRSGNLRRKGHSARARILPESRRVDHMKPLQKQR